MIRTLVKEPFLKNKNMNFFAKVMGHMQYTQRIVLTWKMDLKKLTRIVI